MPENPIPTPIYYLFDRDTPVGYAEFGESITRLLEEPRALRIVPTVVRQSDGTVELVSVSVFPEITKHNEFAKPPIRRF